MIMIMIMIITWGHGLAQFFGAMSWKPKGREFDSRWC